MVYDTKNKYVYINYYEIWTFLRSNFGLNLQETQGLTKKWLDEVYNLRGVTTPTQCRLFNQRWMRYTI